MCMCIGCFTVCRCINCFIACGCIRYVGVSGVSLCAGVSGVHYTQVYQVFHCVQVYQVFHCVQVYQMFHCVQVGLMRGGRMLEEDKPSTLMDRYNMLVNVLQQYAGKRSATIIMLVVVEVLLYVRKNRRFIRDWEPWTATSTFTHLLCSVMLVNVPQQYSGKRSTAIIMLINVLKQYVKKILLQYSGNGLQ